MYKLWLDDERPAPEGWEWVKDANEAYTIIRSGVVTEASLDHDLGNEPYTGYWLLHRIERDKFAGIPYNLPTFTIHSANPVGRKNMEASMRAIANFERSNRENGH